MKKNLQAQRLRLENRRLAQEIKNTKMQKSMELQNSFMSILQGAYATTNITSFNPALQNNIYAPLTLNWTVLMYMYKTHGILQTAIDVPVLDAFRDGLDLQSDEIEDSGDIGELEDFMEETDLLSTICECKIWARLFGGAALIINTDQPSDKPLDLTRKIKKLELYAANRWELYSVWKPNDPQTELNPWLWAAARNSDFVYFYGEKIHKSRILTMSGKAAPYIIRWQLQGWGISEYERMLEDFNVFVKTRNVLYDLLEEAKVDVYKLQGLNQKMISQAAQEQVRRRMQFINENKNYNNGILLDKEDEFEQKQITFSGLAEVMKENRMGIASALRMPITKIFGVSATGFNSGEDDIENYNAMVQFEIRQPMRKDVRKILKLVCRYVWGGDYDISFEYKPLRVLSSVDEENVKTSKQNRYLAEYDRGLIDSEEFGHMAEKDKLNSIHTKAQEGLLEEHPDVNPMGQGDEDGDKDGEEKDSKKGGGDQ